jgi:hypothetical protein
MADYENLMSLVEEVRGLVAYDELEECKGRAALRLYDYFEGRHEALNEKRKKHNPFRYLKGKSLGPTNSTVATKAGPRKHAPTGVWTCKCETPYVCYCKGTRVDSETGEEVKVRKKVTIDKKYKTTYNRLYRSWREKNKKLFRPGKRFSKEPLP